MFHMDSGRSYQPLSRPLPKQLLVIVSEPVSMSAVLSILTFNSMAPAQGQRKNPLEFHGSEHCHLDV